jgi:uncharacterized protein (UPF0335 family)
MADDTPHADVLGKNAQGQVRSIVDRVERLEAEKDAITEQIKEVYAEAKGNGFDAKILKRVVRKRKIDTAKRQEEEAVEDLYWEALGELPLFETVADREAADQSGIATVTLTMNDGSSASGTPDQLAVAVEMVRGASEDEALYDQAVAIVRRDGKASASYVQRRLQLGYNRAAALMERMERDGVVGPPNHAGKREILAQAAA